MGRGRQKAKATKQARDIKYYSPATDYSALQRELASARSASNGYSGQFPDESDGYEDKYADQYADQFDDEDDDSDDVRRLG
ncbi:DUF3073 domain-containing protein [Arthrobacter castelli]|uniref:DUF3073 domain-containing protein n=1 Tax=Arthrobacter castelli TaxID=271431 RepID=UPI00042841E7|nr:DUF3073 domain-containing protein [Arthrobacter castelli]